MSRTRFIADKSINTQVGLGIIAPAHFAKGSDNPVTQKFVKEYEAKYGKIPSLYGFSMYSGIMWVAEALEKMGGKAEDREAMIDTVLKTGWRYYFVYPECVANQPKVRLFSDWITRNRDAVAING